MSRFIVTIEQAPGVMHPSTGSLVRPGSSFEWPDDADYKPSLKYQPMDKAAYDLLVQAHGAKAVKDKHGDYAPYEAPKEDVEVPKSPKALSDALGMNEVGLMSKKGKVRLSDQ